MYVSCERACAHVLNDHKDEGCVLCVNSPLEFPPDVVTAARHPSTGRWKRTRHVERVHELCRVIATLTAIRHPLTLLPPQPVIAALEPRGIVLVVSSKHKVILEPAHTVHTIERIQHISECKTSAGRCISWAPPAATAVTDQRVSDAVAEHDLSR